MSMFANQMPKVVGPRAHAVIDYAVAATFFTVGALFWNRDKRAAISSIICGVATVTNSIFTDYPGGIVKAISYHTHGRIDMGLAGLTATMPQVMGFGDEAESRFFQMQAIGETAITAMTDFNALERTESYRYREAA